MFVLSLLLVSACSNVGVAIVDSNGRVHVRNDRKFPVLSAAKIIPAAAALETLEPTRRFTIRRKVAGYSPSVKVGHTYTVRELAELSVVDSDNSASDALVEALGGKQAVERWLKAKGSRMSFSTESEMVRDEEAFIARPSDLARLMSELRKSPAYPNLLDMMRRTRTGNDRIRRVFPGAPHKSGTGRNHLSDAAYVNGEIIVAMGRTTRGSDLADAVRSMANDLGLRQGSEA